MCTVVILRRPGHPWPLLLAANRDEMKDRPWRPPGRHWPARPHVVAGLDELAGGSWLGINDHRVVAGVLNRVGSLGPEGGKRTRGELVLLALEHVDASAAATRVSLVDPGAYRSFNMVVADRQNAYWLRHGGEAPDPKGAKSGAAGIEVFELPPGLSMITARDRNDPASPRVRANLARFEAAAPPDPRTGRWGSWKRLLASRRHDSGDGPETAMTVITESGFETVSSSLIALPGPPQSVRGNPAGPVWLFAPGRPDQTPFAPVEL
ncbi:MAG: NRDE family protein [Kiloniellaceae bacterium]